MAAVLEARGLWKFFGDLAVLRGINIIVEKPGIIGLLGPNGAGKSTLMKIMAGILRPSRGSVRIMGWDPRDPAARRALGYCPQEPGLYDELSSWDNMLFYARLYGLREAEARPRIRELLDRVGVLEHASKPVGKLSGGLRKRLSLAVAMLSDPQVYLLDEPTTGMDPTVRREVWEILREMRSQGKAVIIATHYMEEADELSDTVYIMDRGAIIASGTPEELKSKFGPPSVVEVEYRGSPSPGALEDVLRGLRHVTSAGIIKVYVDRPEETVPRLAEALYKVGLDIRSIRVVKPTLEDVFLKLAGRRLEEA